MKKIFRMAQFMSHVATVLIAILLSVLIFRQSDIGSAEKVRTGVPQPTKVSEVNSAPNAASPVSPLGKALPLENIDWKANQKTLVIYLSTTCKYCKESIPFYQRLVKENADKSVKLIAVFSQPEKEAKEYLKANSIGITDVQNASLASVGVRGTPSILLVNGEGVVSEYWRGRLQADKESEVLAKLTS